MHRFTFPLFAVPAIKLAIFGASFAGAHVLGGITLVVIVVAFGVCEFCKQVEEEEEEAIGV